MDYPAESTAWINSLITLLSVVLNEFSDKIKYYYSKSSYIVKSLAYNFYVKTRNLADFHICIFVALNCSLNCLHACNVHFLIFTSIPVVYVFIVFVCYNQFPFSNIFHSLVNNFYYR